MLRIWIFFFILPNEYEMINLASSSYFLVWALDQKDVNSTKDDAGLPFELREDDILTICKS